MLQERDALIGWVWLGVEAPSVIRKMNTEQLGLQPKLDALTACRGHLEKDGKNCQAEALCFSVLIVALQRGTEKRRREPEVSVSSAQLSESRRAQDVRLREGQVLKGGGKWCLCVYMCVVLFPICNRFSCRFSSLLSVDQVKDCLKN